MSLAAGTEVIIVDAHPTWGVNGMKATVVRKLTLGETYHTLGSSRDDGYRVKITGRGNNLHALEHQLKVVAEEEEDPLIAKTFEDLAKLATFSIVRGYDGFRHEKQKNGEWLMWSQAGHIVDTHPAEDSVELPARVLYSAPTPKLTVREQAFNAAKAAYVSTLGQGRGTDEIVRAVTDAALNATPLTAVQLDTVGKMLLE